MPRPSWSARKVTAMPDFIDSVADNDAREQDRLEARLRHEAANREQRPGREECVDCDDPIPADRRAALPYAVRCIDCAVIADQRARRRR